MSDESSMYQATWHIEDEGQRVVRVHLEEPSGSIEDPQLIDHGYLKFRVDDAGDVIVLECTIDPERHRAELERLKMLAQTQAEQMTKTPEGYHQAEVDRLAKASSED